MSNDSQVIGKAITTAGITIAIALVFTMYFMKPKSGRYVFVSERADWVIVGDTRTGRSWRCVNESVLKESVEKGEDIPFGFDGCFAISVPSKVQKMNSYEGTMDFTRSARQIIMSKTERSKSDEGYQIHGRV